MVEAHSRFITLPSNPQYFMTAGSLPGGAHCGQLAMSFVQLMFTMLPRPG